MTTVPNDQTIDAAGIPVRTCLRTVPVPPTAVPATIGAGGNYQTGIMPAAGAVALAAACTLSQTGTLAIQRYIDAAGAIAIGAAISQALVANTPATVSVNDGLPFASWKVTITNTSGSVGNLSATAFLQQTG